VKKKNLFALILEGACLRRRGNQRHATKERKPAEVGGWLAELAEKLEEVRGPWAAAVTEPICRAFGEAKGAKPKELFMALRVAVSGRKTSPPLFESMEVMGKELVRRRLRQAAEFLSKQKA